MKVSNTQTISSKTNQFLKIATKTPKTRKTLTRSRTLKENQIKVKKTKQNKKAKLKWQTEIRLQKAASLQKMNQIFKDKLDSITKEDSKRQIMIPNRSQVTKTKEQVSKEN